MAVVLKFPNFEAGQKMASLQHPGLPSWLVESYTSMFSDWAVEDGYVRGVQSNVGIQQTVPDQQYVQVRRSDAEKPNPINTYRYLESLTDDLQTLHLKILGSSIYLTSFAGRFRRFRP